VFPFFFGATLWAKRLSDAGTSGRATTCEAFMRYLIAVVLLVVLPVARAAAARIVIDASTTLDYVIPPSDPPIDIVVGREGLTTVEIVDGANIAPNIHVRDNSLLNIRGGIMGGFVWAHDYGTINIYNGWVATGEDIVADNDSLINIYNGRFGDSIYAVGSGVINLYGGAFDKAGDGATLIADNNGTINVFGSDFVLGPPGDAFRSLTGILSDGTPIDVYVYNYSTTPGPAQVILHTVPEPSASTLFVIAAGSVVALSCRFRSSKRKRQALQ
jgi:hypothetical protein